MRSFIINENDSGQRVDKFILKAIPKLPKSIMYKLIRKKDIKVNGKRCEISTRLNPGDKVDVYINDKLNNVKKDCSFMNAPTEIQIVYEDDNILVVNKPAGLTVHCDNEHENDTLINRIKHYLCNKGSYDPDAENSFSPALCSRLDRNTCGLVTAAKNAASLRELNECVRNDKVNKIYRCAVVGTPPISEDTLKAYHFKENIGNIVKISDSPLNGYKKIKTGYKVLRSNSELSLLEVKLYTGRTHQIRAHLAYIGIPVLGDGKYGNLSANKHYQRYSQCLCAYSLEFNFAAGSILEYLNDKVFTAPIPEFEKLIR